VEFYHVIGPQTPHKIKAEAKPEIEAVIEDALARREAVPKKVRFTTYSLIYPQMEWVKVLGMEKQWERADVAASRDEKGVKIETKNVSALRWELTTAQLKPGSTLTIDGQDVPIDVPAIKDNLIKLVGGNFLKENGRWVRPKGRFELGVANIEPNFTKRPDLCGPVDHAFMSSFVFVRPTGQPLNDKVGAWAAGELDHATGFWRKVFRGEAPVKDDTAISDADIASSNLVLWGDPSSNAVLKKIIDRLPLKWTAQELALVEKEPRMNTDGHGSKTDIRVSSVPIRGQKYDAAHTAPVLIFPNPLNPAKYVVLNSGPTFREDALLNNSQQIPKLPDWAFIDVNTAPDGKWPGLVIDAGFFDEQWKAPGK